MSSWHCPDIESARHVPHCSGVSLSGITSLLNLDQVNDTMNIAKEINEGSNSSINNISKYLSFEIRMFSDSKGEAFG